jgi:tetratricopeptide (TPR) repeat protein
MKFVLKYISFVLLIFCVNLYGQAANEYRLNSSFNKNGTTSKENFKTEEEVLRESVKSNPSPVSLLKLAKVCIDKNTISGRVEARELLTRTIYLDPQNIECRLLLAQVLKRISDGLAYKVYKDILEIDSTCAAALYNLGRIKESEFNDYHNSVLKEEDDASLSFEIFAQDDFRKAEEYFTKAIKYDSLNREAYLHLSFLYEDNGKPENGLPVLKRLVQIYPNDDDAHLYLGLLYYETSQIEKSFKEYQNALALMTDSLREDFTYNSVKKLIEPVFGEKLKEYSENDIKEIIDYFWKITNPLYISDYNARLLEHYSRVAYSNLRFGSNAEDVIGAGQFRHVGTTPKATDGQAGLPADQAGWQTDKGEIILRYGMPLEKIRYRPQISAGGRTSIDMKTDVWYYKNFTLGFTDQFWTGKYVYSEPIPGSIYNPQFKGDTPMLVDYLRKVRYQNYVPKFEGPSFDVPYTITQFKSGKYNYTDIYINYALDAADSLRQGNTYYYKYNWGMFFFDTVFNTISKKNGTINEISANRKINIKGGNSLLVNSLELSIYPGKGNIAFEIEREIDKGVSSNHFEFDPKKFKVNELDISDLILASKLKHDSLSTFPVVRNNTGLLPNPTNIFSIAQPIFIYYELYNLELENNNLSSFEQKLILKKKTQSSGFSSAVNSMLNVVGLGKQKEEVTITTKYQTHEKDSQIDFMLDMHNYLPGDYVLTIIITDNISHEEVYKDIFLTLR